MNYKFNFDLQDLDGKTIPDGKGGNLTAGRLLATTLANSSKGEVLKLYDWSKKLIAGEPLNLDRTDRDMLKELVRNNESLTIMSKGQILEVLVRSGEDE